MNDAAIFLPLAALAIWTLLVLLLVPIHRFRAAAQHKVTASDFRFGESAAVPGDVSIPNRAWMNLLEAPLLFYVACIIAFSIHAVAQSLITLAWAYVGVRVVHTLIHITYNRVLHRLTAFAISNVILVMIWIHLVLTLLPLAA